LLFIVNR